MKTPTIYQLKPAFQDLLRPLCFKLEALGVSANQVTILAAVLSILQGTWIFLRPESPLALLWGTISFLAGVGVPLAMWINWILCASIVLLVLTVYNRIRSSTR